MVKGFSNFVGLIFGHAIELSFWKVLAKYSEISELHYIISAWILPPTFGYYGPV